MFTHENLPVEQLLKAVYEDGVFRPLEPVDLKEHQQVTLAIEIVAPNDPEADDNAEENLADLATRFFGDQGIDLPPHPAVPVRQAPDFAG